MDSPTTADFSRLIAQLARALDAAEIPFMLIGGQAVLLHGEARLTQDIDITLGIAPERLQDILRICEQEDLVPLPEDIHGFVAETFVLPANDPTTGVRVDFVFSTSDYEQTALERAVLVEMGGEHVAFASAEDLILHKVFAGRPRDLEDAAGVVRRKGQTLDWDFINRWGGAFAQVPGREDVPEQLRKLQEKA
jgi:predicted nucleotidyltransferase